MKIEEMVEFFEKRLAWVKENRRDQKSKHYGAEIMLDYFGDVARAKEEGKPLAWISLAFPVELLHAMDIVSFCPEQFAIQNVCSFQKYEYFDIGWRDGFNKECCSAHAATIGMAYSDDLPHPDIILCSGPSPCDSSNMMFEVLSDVYKKPTFYLNHPYNPDDNSVKHYLQELKDLIRFLEEHTGHKVDQDKLRGYLENSRQVTQYIRKTHSLRKQVPSPMHGKLAMEGWGYRTMSEGLPKVLKYFEAEYNETRETADRGEGAIPEERYRLVLNGAWPMWNMKMFEYMEQTFKAIVVVDWNNLIGYLETPDDISDPMLALARKNQTGTSVEFYNYPLGIGKKMVSTCAEAQVNSSIFMMHFGCIVNCGYVRQVVDDLRDQLGIPTAVIDIDAMNPLLFSWAQIKSQIDEYFAMLEEQNKGKPSLWSREKVAYALAEEEEDKFTTVSLR